MYPRGRQTDKSWAPSYTEPPPSFPPSSHSTHQVVNEHHAECQGGSQQACSPSSEAQSLERKTDPDQIGRWGRKATTMLNTSKEQTQVHRGASPQQGEERLLESVHLGWVLKAAVNLVKGEEKALEVVPGSGDPGSKPSSAPQRCLGAWASHLPSLCSFLIHAHSGNSISFPDMLCKGDEVTWNKNCMAPGGIPVAQGCWATGMTVLSQHLSVTPSSLLLFHFVSVLLCLGEGLCFKKPSVCRVILHTWQHLTLKPDK